MIFPRIILFTMVIFTLKAHMLQAADSLVIISPHRKSIQQEFIPAFQEHYKKTYKTDVKVEWIDQGGTSDDIRFIRARFKKNPKTADIDIFWGGGTLTFLELNAAHYLAKYQLPNELKKEIPASASGVPLYDASETWYASAMSAFGIFYNKRLLKLEKLSEPKSWQDLAHPQLKNLVSLTDPRRSGTYTLMMQIALASKGWDKGWQLLHEIAGNARKFTHLSSDPIKDVVSGDAVAAMAVDFYAAAKIADLGSNNLGFVIPEGETILDPDPIAILKGAPHRQVAERFINFVLSAEAQKLLILPKGHPAGPKHSILGRMAVNVRAYNETEGQRLLESNPFKFKNFLKLDMKKLAQTNNVFRDLVGACLVDTHSELRETWDILVKSNKIKLLLKDFAAMPVAESQLEKEAKTWDNDVYRNKKINEWVAFARKKFATVKKQALSH